MPITLQDWREWADSHTVLPYVQSYDLSDALPLTWEPFWERSSEYAFVLESGKTGRYSMIASHPVSVIWGKGDQAIIASCGKQEKRRLHGKPLDAVRMWLKPYRSPQLAEYPHFLGGCVGYFGYDVVRSLERLPSIAADDLEYPDYVFMMVNRCWIIDHADKRLHCAVHTHLPPLLSADRSELIVLFQQAQENATDMRREWDELLRQAAICAPAVNRKERFAATAAEQKYPIDVAAISGLSMSFSREGFVQAVRDIQEYIRQGDCFQVNLSVRQDLPLACDPATVYEWLRLLNPSPYMGFLKLPAVQIVSASPELLVKLMGRKLITRPIAGTRPRGGDIAEDKAMSGELLASEKERAEHVMLVDLERNDLGRISRYGSVRVQEFMALEAYSHVIHIVSQVEGELAAGNDAFDVIAAMLPGGTITGAPKIRTMEIIEELEPVRRGPYTGSIGWIDYNGNMEFNIVIRTLLASNGMAHVQSGAGIVSDSDPEQEYAESLSKAKALWKAVQYGEMENAGRPQPFERSVRT